MKIKNYNGKKKVALLLVLGICFMCINACVDENVIVQNSELIELQSQYETSLKTIDNLQKQTNKLIEENNLFLNKEIELQQVKKQYINSLETILNLTKQTELLRQKNNLLLSNESDFQEVKTQLEKSLITIENLEKEINNMSSIIIEGGYSVETYIREVDSLIKFYESNYGLVNLDISTPVVNDHMEIIKEYLENYKGEIIKEREKQNIDKYSWKVVSIHNKLSDIPVLGEGVVRYGVLFYQEATVFLEEYQINYSTLNNHLFYWRIDLKQINGKWEVLEFGGYN